MMRLTGACAALFCLTAPALAWEVVQSAAPTLALNPALAARAPDAAAFAGKTGFSDGQTFRLGGDFLLGVDVRKDFAWSNPFAAAAGFDGARTSVKFGYDLGRFKPFVTGAFSEVRGPAFGDPFAAASGSMPFNGTPFASARSSTAAVGAGFEYAVTEKLSFGVAVSASQTSGWQR